MNFHILIDDVFSLLTKDSSLTPIEKKKVLSIVNDFENGKWNTERFQKFVWNNIKETALSYKERNALIGEGEDSILTEAAKNLRLSESENDIGKGSEIAEIVLYGIMKHHYKALPVVPKIFYKQNTQDNAKGADSVHIVVENENEFSLWFGESKFYDSIENARLTKVIESVKNTLSLKKLKKENAIITSVSDINEFEELSKELRDKIVKSLSQSESIDTIKPLLNVPILLLHECQITKSQTHLTESYMDSIKEFHKERATEYFKNQIKKCADVDMYSEIKFHIILFPVPEKNPLVEKFISKASVLRG
jgi:hypothetical protein